MRSVVFRFKADAMQRIAHLVSHGYTRWVAGEISPGKAEALALKFDDRYHVCSSEIQRYRARKRGDATADLTMWWDGKSTVHWVLLVFGTGDGLVTQMEALSSCVEKSGRIELTGYELVREPRKGQSGKSWSWRMTSSTEARHKSNIKAAIRQKNQMKIRQAVDSLRRIPGFRLARHQARGLWIFAKHEWRRSMPNSEKWPYGRWAATWQGRRRVAEMVEFPLRSRRSAKAL